MTSLSCSRFGLSSSVAALLALLAMGPMRCAEAAHPLVTEDTGTQGEGVVEIENGLAWSRQGAISEFSYQPQLALGLTPRLDAILLPSWLSNRVKGEPSVRGFGDTHLDLKWRFAEAQPWSVALRSGVALATGENGLGLPHGRAGVHALLAATWADAAIAFHGNVGLTHLPLGDGSRDTSAHVSAAFVWKPGADWALLAEAGAESNTERGSQTWPASVLVGAVRTLRPGTDVDIGYRLSFGQGVTTRVVLLGFTVHFTR